VTGIKNNETFNEYGNEIKDELKTMCEECETCRRYKRNPSKPVVGFPLATSFNEVLAMDLGEIEGKRFIVMVDHATSYIQATWIANKQPKVIVIALLEKWISVFGAPKKILSDNGLEFQNEEVKEMTESFGIEILSTPAESPWSNGKCEKMVGILKDSIRKLREEGVKESNSALWWSVAAKNSLIMKDGFSPNQLVFGR
jgi:transposase InsO family protein